LNGRLAWKDSTSEKPPIGLRLYTSLSGKDLGTCGVEEENIRAAFDEVVECNAILIVRQEATAKKELVRCQKKDEMEI
jgi:hypothetical protein